MRTHFKQLDGLRFAAVFLVLVEHFAGFIGNKIHAGAYGVDLFFVISGFLITNILLSSDKPFSIAYYNFMGRRMLRIFPLYYSTILILLVLNYQPVKDDIWYLLSYTYNYAFANSDYHNTNISHFWSLSVEEQFYIFWPLFILTTRKYPKLFIITLILLTLFCYAQFCFNIVSAIVPYNQAGLIPRGGAILLGAVGTVLYRNTLLPARFFKSLFWEIFIFLVLCYTLVVEYNLRHFILGCCSLFIVLKAVKQNFQIGFINSLLNNKRVVYLGTISYGIYILHLPLSHYVMGNFFDPYIWEKIHFGNSGILSKLFYNEWLIRLPIMTLLTVFVAHLSYKYFETPILRLKDRYFKYE